MMRLSIHWSIPEQHSNIPYWLTRGKRRLEHGFWTSFRTSPSPQESICTLADDN